MSGLMILQFIRNTSLSVTIYQNYILSSCVKSLSYIFEQGFPQNHIFVRKLPCSWDVQPHQKGVFSLLVGTFMWGEDIGALLRLLKSVIIRT